jgi:hypothetical protein
VTSKSKSAPKAKRARGRPSYKPDQSARDLVAMMATIEKATHAEIARALNITIPTLEKHFRDELDSSKRTLNARVAANIFRIAMGDGAQALKAAQYWLATRAGWSEYAPPPKDPTKPDDKPPASAPLGKKEALDQAAQEIPNGRWSTLVN